jgi:hypothetical protein
MGAGRMAAMAGGGASSSGGSGGGGGPQFGVIKRVTHIEERLDTFTEHIAALHTRCSQLGSDQVQYNTHYTHYTHPTPY